VRLRTSFASCALGAAAVLAAGCATTGPDRPAPAPAGAEEETGEVGEMGETAAPAEAAAGAAPAAGLAFPYPVHEIVLDNGLEVVAIPYDSPGTVAYFTVVRTGSRQEVEPGHSGFAHFFEHMMFRGTERYSQDEYNDVLKRMGADSNAFTTDDYTNYYIVGPAAKLETMMELEADRFLNLAYDEEGFRTEALAVLGEYNKNASSPFLPMFEKVRDLAFDEHTYQHTTLGFLEDIEAMPGYYDYSLRFFDRFYRPENTVVLVVGDVEPERVFALARRYYGGWERGYRGVEIAAEPEQAEARSAELDWPTPTRPRLMIAYRAPAFEPSSTETAALDLVGQLLFAESAPLYQELVVDEQWVDFISGDASWHRDPYLFMVNAQVKSPELVPKVRRAIEEALAGLAERPVDPERLDRIQRHLRYDFALSLDSPAAVGFAAAEMLQLTGGVDGLNAVYAGYREATPADVRRVAREVFQPSRQTVVTLMHSPGAGGDPAAAEGGAR